MRFKATDVYDYYKPSACARRVALRARDEPEQETATPFLELLRTLGHRHEAVYLHSLSGVVDLTGPDQEERERRTVDAIRAGAAAIYQPRFRLDVVLDLDGETCELVGEPDFLIYDAARGGYLIRDSKLARNPLSDRHAGIVLQLQIYGFLYERAVGRPALELQVHAGTGEIVPIPYEGEAAVLAVLREQRHMRAAPLDVYEPVGWTKCGGCGYEDRCWGEAEAAGDISLLSVVDQSRARTLRSRGVAAISDVHAAIENLDLRDLFYEGKKTPHLRSSAIKLQRSAEAYLSKKVVPIATPALPDAPNFVMFDLEGLPQYLDETEKIYLWGLKVFGEKPSGYLAAQAGFGPDGDRDGWFGFLRLADRLFVDHGPDLRFVHWGSYEKDKINKYITRYGDMPLSTPPPPTCHPEEHSDEGSLSGPDSNSPAVAARVLANLVNLLDVTRTSVVLPLPSYSLKVVEKHVGFERKLPDTGGQWSIAKYIESTETNDPAARAEFVSQILAYNEEDLDATWAVMEWLERLPPPAQ